MMTVVDCHAHVVPREFPRAPRAADEALWPSMKALGDGRSQMLIGDKPFRSFASFYWDAGARIRRLDEAGTDIEVVSPLPELLSYWLPPASGAVVADFMNETIAAMVAAHPSRFAGFGIVSLQDLDVALRQLSEFGRLGLRGILVGSHVDGLSVADPAFDPFYHVAEALGLPIMIHGIKPVTTRLGPPPMPAVFGIPAETAGVIGNFIRRDILGTFPHLQLIFAHGGGTIGALIDRFEVVWSARADMRESQPLPPSRYLARFHFDTAVFNPQYVAYLAGNDCLRARMVRWITASRSWPISSLPPVSRRAIVVPSLVATRSICWVCPKMFDLKLQLMPNMSLFLSSRAPLPVKSSRG